MRSQTNESYLMMQTKLTLKPAAVVLQRLIQMVMELQIVEMLARKTLLR